MNAWMVIASIAATAGFCLGFLIAAIMSASGESDRQLEAMRQKHIADVTDWLERQQSKGGSQ